MASDDSMYNQMMEEAAIARRKEAERKANIAKGMAAVRDAFEGKQTGSKNVNVNWNKIDIPTYGGRSKLEYGGSTLEGLPAGYTLEPNAKNTGWVVKGPDKKLYNIGDVISYSVPTGPRAGGFDEPFYKKFAAGYEGNYLPEVGRQYGEALTSNKYNLANAGLTNSSVRGETVSDLYRQNLENTADIRAAADKAAGNLRKDIAGQRIVAEGQVQSAEDPESGVNTALAAVKNLKLEQPDSTPLGKVFELALIGGGNAMSGYTNAQALNNIRKMSSTYNAPGTTVV
jgi:hypothetical protein